ncbi:unnamed protein product [Arctogadus glacialis]
MGSTGRGVTLPLYGEEGAEPDIQSGEEGAVPELQLGEEGAELGLQYPSPTICVNECMFIKHTETTCWAPTQDHRTSGGWDLDQEDQVLDQGNWDLDQVDHRTWGGWNLDQEHQILDQGDWDLDQEDHRTWGDWDLD